MGAGCYAREQRVRSSELKLVPAHMRDLGRARGERDDLAPDPAQPRMAAMLEPGLGHQLHADANAEEGPAVPMHDALQRLDHAGQAVEPGPAIGEGADAGQHDARGGRHLGGIGRDPDFGASGGQRLGGRAQVAGAVVDDRGDQGRVGRR